MRYRSVNCLYNFSVEPVLSPKNIYMPLPGLRLASVILLAIFSAVSVYHLLILTGIIPAIAVWGGKLSDMGQIVVAEIFSLIVNFLFMLLVAGRGRFILKSVRPSFFRTSMWAIFAIMALNTLGNLFAESSVETWAFTPLTLISALLALRLALLPAPTLA
jgi:hypothetical protein